MAAPMLTDEQCREAVDALEAHDGNQSAAAASLGMNRATFLHRVREGRRRFREFETTRVTTATDKDGNVTATYTQTKPDRGEPPPAILPGFAPTQRTVHTVGGEVYEVWEQQKPEAVAKAAAVREIFEAFAEPVTGMAPLLATPQGTDDDLLTLYPMGDPHFGLHCWGKETGEDFDLAEAERLTCAAIDRLVSLSPNSRQATLLNLGDFYHMNNQKNVTPQSGHQLDVDTRFRKVVRVGAKAMRWSILRLLEKHERVRVRNVRGNHDDEASLALEMALEAYFENDPRVEVDASPALFGFQRFGKVLLADCHGDTAKPADLPGVMMNDAREHISATEFWHWHCGHVHHDSLKEYQGVIVETHRTLAPGDAWHRGRGYRAGRSMKSISYHREYGEVHRSTCDVSLLRKLAA